MYKKKLVIFNLSTDLQDYLLAHTHDWIEEFAKHFQVIWVYSTHIGQTSLPKTVQLTEIGGGGCWERARALLRLARILGLAAKFHKEVIVFHHMSSRTVGLLSWPLKALQITQGVWYSHPHADRSLKFGIKAVDVAFAPNRVAFPVASLVNNLVETGHGLKFPPFPFSNVLDRKAEILRNLREEKEVVISVIGRVSPVKRIEYLFHAVETLESRYRERLIVRLIGPLENKQALAKLQALAINVNVRFEYLGVIIGKQLWNQIFSSTFVYNGTNSSIDKSALIASSLGTPVLSENPGILELTGIVKMGIYKTIDTPIVNQIQKMLSLNESEFVELMRMTYIQTRKRNDIRSTISTISNELTKRSKW